MVYASTVIWLGWCAHLCVSNTSCFRLVFISDKWYGANKVSQCSINLNLLKTDETLCFHRLVASKHFSFCLFPYRSSTLLYCSEFKNLLFSSGYWRFCSINLLWYLTLFISFCWCRQTVCNWQLILWNAWNL